MIDMYKLVLPMKLNQKYFSIVLIFLSLNSHQSFAAGYSTNLTSTSGLGNIYAGSVTGIHDVSDMFFNPAITSGLKHKEFIASVSYVDIKIDPDNVSGRFSNGTQATGTEVKNAGTNKLVPALYLATPINDKIAFGLSITSPFGLSTKYDKNWIGRYHAVESSITTYNINPSLSYKINEKLSVGAGVQAQYLEALLTKAVRTSGADAIGRLHGSDWGYGYNFGVSYQANDQLKLAIGYRSKIDYKIICVTQVADLGLYSDFHAETTTPESATIGAAFKLNKKIELAYDGTWTRWSRLQSIVANAHQDSRLNYKADFNWHDSFLHSFGANFTLNDTWLIRSGIAYEKDATSNSTREPRVPTGDRVSVGLGFNYKITKGLSVDTAYVHQFYKNAKVNITDSTTTVNSLEARYKTKVNVFSVALKKEF